MSAAVELRDDYSAGELRKLAARSPNGNQARRLLALAAVCDGMSRDDAARIGGMDRQTLRDWVHAFNARGPDGLVNCKGPGAKPKMPVVQSAGIAGLAGAGPDPATDVVVRWRCAGLQRIIKARFNIDLSEQSIGRQLRVMGFSHISARPRHPAQGADVIEDFKKTSPAPSKKR